MLLYCSTHQPTPLKNNSNLFQTHRADLFPNFMPGTQGRQHGVPKGDQSKAPLTCLAPGELSEISFSLSNPLNYATE